MNRLSSQVFNSVIGVFAIFFFTPLIAQENHQECIGFHVLDSDFKSIFYNDNLVDLPNDVCLNGEFLQYAYTAREDGKIYAEIIDLPRFKSRGSYVINSSSAHLGLLQSGTYYRGYGLLNSTDPTCVSPWGSDWTKLDSLGNEEFTRSQEIDSNGKYVITRNVKWENGSPVSGKKVVETYSTELKDECYAAMVGIEKTRILTDDATEEYRWLERDKDGEVLKYERQFTTLTESWFNTWTRKYATEDFKQEGPLSRESLANRQIDWIWPLRSVTKYCDNKDDKGVIVGGHPEFPNATSITHNVGNLSLEKGLENKDFRISSSIEQPYDDGSRGDFRFNMSYYFTNDWRLNILFDYEWGGGNNNGTVTCVWYARGMEISRKHVTSYDEEFDIWANSNSININQIGENIYVAINSSVVCTEEIKLIPTGQMTFWGWNGEKFMDYQKRKPDPNFKSYVTSADLTYFDVESKSTLKSQKSTENDVSIAGSGSGVVIDAQNGYLATNYHVVEDSRGLFVEVDGKRWDATVVRTDANNDLALIQVEESARGKLSTLPISLSAGLGSKAFAAGYPKLSTMGKDIKITEGLISSVSFLDDPTKFQISCPITNGNSGGALLDNFGNLIGITQGGYRPDNNTENVNAAVKGLYVMALAQAQSGCAISTESNQSVIDFESLRFSVLPILILK